MIAFLLIRDTQKSITNGFFFSNLILQTAYQITLPKVNSAQSFIASKITTKFIIILQYLITFLNTDN
ncbi:hypothetical protein N134_08580 [Limosilactobacillus reuteri TD1]|uniref:Uncharacterized protein n=1 Tax=Limosilactobacillus reuteri TD1 TaxID=1358027 RepID=S5NYR2_LIMRT|nr:hypothetical protein N134_08580 [Limosilactobacillus reuteri TD1]